MRMVNRADCHLIRVADRGHGKLYEAWQANYKKGALDAAMHGGMGPQPGLSAFRARGRLHQRRRRRLPHCPIALQCGRTYDGKHQPRLFDSFFPMRGFARKSMSARPRMPAPHGDRTPLLPSGLASA